MLSTDAGAALDRLSAVTLKLRAARTLQGVLEMTADGARAITGSHQTWAARIEERAVVSMATSCAGDAIDRRAPSPSFVSLLTASDTDVSPPDGFVLTPLRGLEGSIEGVLAITAAAPARSASPSWLAPVLAQWASVAGFALEAARRKAQLSAVERGRESLLASIAHDLRSPLNTFAMSTQLLRTDFERNEIDPARGLSLLSRIDRAIARTQIMLADLREASEVDAKKVVYSIGSHDAAQLMSDAVEAAQRCTTADVAQVHVTHGNARTSVLADRARVLEVFARVIAMARAAAGDGGYVSLSVSRQKRDAVFSLHAKGTDHRTPRPLDRDREALSILIARGHIEGQRGTFHLGEHDLDLSFSLPVAPP